MFRHALSEQVSDVPSRRAPKIHQVGMLQDARLKWKTISKTDPKNSEVEPQPGHRHMHKHVSDAVCFP